MAEININKLKIAFIGSGTMAEAMISSLLHRGLSEPQNMYAAGPRIDRGHQLQTLYGINTNTENSKAASLADVVVLCVKPQRLNTVLEGLQGIIKSDAFVLSIVAGASISKILNGLSHPAIIRAMPNTPAQIGAGITVWTASKSVSNNQLDQTRKILGAMGDEIYLEDENYLDMATALSGTGPSYVFLFMEALIDAGVHLGFPRRIAEQLVIKTLQGSVEFYTKSELHLSALRNAVTSPGGTSAEALYFLEKAGFRTAISRAIWAAYERSLELGYETPGNAPDGNVTNNKVQ
jgi:pyrroline-5-carboxylate reductase